MHDAPTPAEPGATAEERLPERPAGVLSAERIDRVLADFRSYLEALLDPPDAPASEPAAFDLTALVAQFTALRHDVNLQTKAARAATEQVAALASAPKPVPPPPDTSEATKPLLKALIDIADTLTTAERQVGRSHGALAPVLDALAAPPLPEPPTTDIAKPGFFGKLFGGGKSGSTLPRDLQEWVSGAVAADAARVTAGEKLTAVLDGLADGYAMSRRRVEKVLPQFGLEVIECVGRPFDPELMEVTEAVGDTGRASGVVVEVVRNGYRLNGQVFRFAMVKVAR